MDNLETALGTQDTERRQAKYKNYNRKSKTKKMSNTDPPKKRGWTQVLKSKVQNV